MRLSNIHSSLLGIAVFLTATLILWKPGTNPKETRSPVDEAKRGVFFAAARSQTRVAAAGEHGRILYSTDKGKTWVRGRTPFDVPLTGIYLLNDRLGWAVGYDGVILKTRDGGASWACVKKPLPQNPPLFAVWFKDKNTGLAVGADSMVYRTVDGGIHWNAAKMEVQSHLYSIAETDDGQLWIAGENHTLYHSPDLGIHWQKIEPPFTGSFFGSLPLPDHKLMTFGLRGRISLWDTSGLLKSKKETDENLLAGVRLQDGRIILVGQRGRVLIGQDDKGWLFRSMKISPEEDIGAVVEVTDALIFTGEFGILRIPKSDMGI